MKTELENAIKNIQKAYGKGAITQLGSSDHMDVDVVSTGIPEIDSILSIGGIPRGRVTEIYGPESGGKTTLTLTIIAQVQKLGGAAAFIDAEHSLDPVYARALGVDTDSLWISQPDSGEEALEIAEALIKSGEVSIVVVDSVAALVPRAELEGQMGDAQMGLQARLMSQALRKLTAVTHKSNTILIFVNQLREKFVMFGSPETTTGGKALKFYSSVRIDIRKAKAIKKGDVVVGAETKLKVAKNKLAAPFKECTIRLEYGRGFVSEEL